MAEILKHLWPLLLTDIITIWSAVGIMVATNAAVLTTVLGVILFSYAVYSLTTMQTKTVRPFGAGIVASGRRHNRHHQLFHGLACSPGSALHASS